jgi:lipopolysaccharide biosynthesis glycosyltransferase
MKIAIVLITDENYLPVACCAAISCRRAGRATEPIILIVVDVSDNSVETARRYLKEQGVEVEIVHFHPDLSAYRADLWISPAAYARLHLDQILDKTWDRVLYLDADMRVLAPLSPLLRADLDGRVLGAAYQYLGRGDQANLDQPDLERLSMAADSRIMNSGVLLFEWPALLSSGLLAQTRRFAAENPYLCKMWDQDALNKVFEGLWKPLNPRWNFGNKMAKTLPREHAFIKHYSNRSKPWGPEKAPFWLVDAFWYWRVMRRSPWPDFAHPIKLPDVGEGLRWLYRVYLARRPSYRLSDDEFQLERVPKIGHAWTAPTHLPTKRSS